MDDTAEYTESHKKKRPKFKTFLERLKAIKVNGIHKVQHVEPLLETENSSKLVDCLIKWRMLDLTAAFKSCSQEMWPKSRSYKMVVHYQNDLSEILKRYLQEKDSLALQSLLELLVALSADLGPDFYPRFFTFFPILTDLLKTNNPKKLEWIFVAISLLFHNLWRYMVDDMENVLNLYKSLLTDNHPPHIASFAGESISFLLRKVREPKHVFVKLFNILKTDSTSEAAIAKVIFHMFKSSQNQFYSKTETLLPIILQLSKSDSDLYAYSSVSKCIEIFIELMAEHTKKEFGLPVWKPLISEIDFHTKHDKNIIYVTNLVKYLNIWCKFSKGAKVVNERDLINSFADCFSLINNASISCDTIELYCSLCELAATILISKLDLNFEDKESVLSALVENIPSLEAVLKLWYILIKQSNFSTSYLQMFLKFCYSWIQIDDYNMDIIKLLVYYSLMNLSLPQDSQELSTFKPHLLDFSFISMKQSTLKLVDILNDIISKSHVWSDIWYCLVLLLSLKPLNDNLKKTLKNLALKLIGCEKLDNEKLAVFSMCCQVCYKLYDSCIFQELQSRQFMTFFVEKYFNKHCLFIVDIILSKTQHVLSQITEKQQEILLDLLEKNMLSPDPAIRRLTLKVFFYIDSCNSVLYDACLAVENIPASFLDIRAKVHELSKLQQLNIQEFSKRSKRILVCFLVSNFYVNFLPLHKPIQEVLCTITSANSQDPFWSVFVNSLGKASRTLQTAGITLTNENELSFNDDTFQSVVIGHAKYKKFVSNDRINHVNFRIMLWKTMCLLPHPKALEAHIDELLTIFYDFLGKEFFQVDHQLSPCIELSNHGTCSISDEQRSHATSLLVTMFKVFARFSKLNSHPQSDSLLQLFTDFLGHSNNNLQVSAFKCILSFKNAYVLKYKDTLLSFLDEKKFRDIITQFSINDLSVEERPVIMDILLQILYGKMKTKEKFGVSGNASPVTRRALIVRFLSGITTNEMSKFAQMLCRPYIKYIESLNLDQYKSVAESLQCSKTLKFISAGKQHAILKCIQLLLVECSPSLTIETYTWLFKLLLQVDAINNGIIENKGDGQITGQLVTSLKNVNKLSMDCVKDLVTTFPDTHCFDSTIIDMFFNTHVWPKLPKLIHESSGKPGFLLKIFSMFAKTSTCLPLLAKLNPNNKSNEFSSPLSAFANLLVSQKCSSDVGLFVIDMLMSSLEETEINDDDSMETDEILPSAAECFKETIQKAIVVAGKLCFKVNSQHMESKLDFGLAMIEPYFDKILMYFFRKMKSSKKGYILPNNCLLFLSIIGKRITEKDLLSDFTELLLDHVASVTAKKITSDEEKTDSYTLCLNSLSTMIRDTKHIVKIAKLFSRLTERHHRILLVSILQSACQNDSDFQWTCKTATNLNSWHRRRVNEIDFESRITALDDIVARIKSVDDVAIFDRDCQLFLPVMHCCLYILKAFSSDLSLKECVIRIFELLAKKINDLFSFDFDYAYIAYQKLIQQLLLPCIQDGLNLPDIEVRFDRIKLLSVLVTYFPNEPSLRGLDVLRNEKDIEADSFENLRHMQTHRRARAYVKVATVLREQHSLTQSTSSSANKNADEENVVTADYAKSKFASRRVISCETAMKYIFPIASQSLYNDSFKNASNLFDACLELFKVCILIAPWRMYKKQLIKTMTDTLNTSHQVRFKIVCSLLNAFPYDLSLYYWKNTEVVSAEQTISQDFIVEPETEAASDEIICNASQNEILSRNRLNASEAEVILTDVIRLILPSLYNLFSVQDQSVSKLLKRNVSLGSSERKLPYALPIILLLKKLPESILETNLPTVLLNVFAFLKHRDYEVRSAAMQSITKVLEVLGFPYFYVILKQLNLTLVNGFQRQLIHYVVHCMIERLLPSAKVGVFDESLSLLLDIAYESLFGKVADKKEEDVLKQSLPELEGGIKTYSIYRNISKYIRKHDFATILEPFKAKLIETHNSKETKIAVTALAEIANGFLCNEDLKLNDTLKLIHGLITDNISSLFPESNDKFAAEKNKRQQPESCLILPSAPKRYGAAPISKTASTNIHILVEFALNLLKRLLESNANLVDQETLEMLDPLVPHLTRCLSSSHANTIVGAANCFSKLYRTNLPSILSNSKTIIKSLFKLIQENSNEMGNSNIANSSFHSLRILCTSDYGKNLSVTQLKMLLSYAETDMHDESRRSNSFKLIKTIMTQGLQCKELVEVIVKVRCLTIQSQSPVCQDQARALYLHFLSNYPMLPNQLESQLNFVLSNLTYEYESGRLSALKILSSVAETFPEKLLNKSAGIIFVPTAAVMINDESATCRRSAGAVIKSLLRNLDQESADQLFSFVLQWLVQLLLRYRFV